MPDEDSFIKKSEDVDKVFFSLCDLNKSTTPEELALLLSKSDNKVAEATNKIFEDGSLKGTNYSENVYKTIIKEL